MKNKFVLLFLLVSIISFAQNQKAYTGNYNEPYRPAFHFSPQEHWMNDPNGMVYFNGKYHLFFQHYPEDIVWGPMHWGHAESTDLIHWNHLPIALYPDSLGYIFSGSAVIDKENTSGFGKNALVAIFTYHNNKIYMMGYKNTESQGLAYSLDEGRTWTKYKDNPVLNNSGQQDFRDPSVFWNYKNNNWIMALAVHDRIKIFSSPNLKNWKFESDFKPENDIEGLGVWECPNLFKINYGNEEKWVMIVNQGNGAPNGGSGTRYFVGNFDGKVFTNDQPSIWMDYGTDFYAGVTYNNIPNNKRILLAWMSNWQYANKTPTKVWRNAMTLPRELELKKENGQYFLQQKFVGSFDSLTSKIFEEKTVKTPFHKNDINLSQTEIKFRLNDNTQNIVIEFSNKINEVFKIQLKDNQLLMDRTKSGKVDFSEKFADKIQIMPLEDKIRNFNIVLDHSSVEVLLNNGKYSMTNQFFPNEDYSILNIDTKNSEPVSDLKMKSVSSIWKKK